jgi:hypothetical protein
MEQDQMAEMRACVAPSVWHVASVLSPNQSQASAQFVPCQPRATFDCKEKDCCKRLFRLQGVVACKVMLVTSVKSTYKSNYLQDIISKWEKSPVSGTWTDIGQIIAAIPVSKLNRHDPRKPQHRLLILTHSSLYSIETKKIEVKDELKLSSISKISCSLMRDGLFVLHGDASDYLFRNDDLCIEFITNVMSACNEMQHKPALKLENE